MIHTDTTKLDYYIVCNMTTSIVKLGLMTMKNDDNTLNYDSNNDNKDDEI